MVTTAIQLADSYAIGAATWPGIGHRRAPARGSRRCRYHACAGRTTVAAPASPNVLLIPWTGSIAHLRETWPPKE